MAANSNVEVHHPSWQEYVKIGVILTVVTAVEVAIVYIDALKDVLLPILLTLGTVKFILVVAYYMHLKPDHKFFAAMFTAGLLMALGVCGGIMAMFGVFS
jgi:cytochrome c oxidase subunit 4